MLFRLATKGRLIVIGFITGYESKLGFNPVKTGTLIPKVWAYDLGAFMYGVRLGCSRKMMSD